MNSNQERESLNLRVPAALKRQVEQYAQVRGISVNAAASILLSEGLRSEKRRGAGGGAGR